MHRVLILSTGEDVIINTIKKELGSFYDAMELIHIVYEYAFARPWRLDIRKSKWIISLSYIFCISSNAVLSAYPINKICTSYRYACSTVISSTNRPHIRLQWTLYWVPYFSILDINKIKTTSIYCWSCLFAWLSKCMSCCIHH